MSCTNTITLVCISLELFSIFITISCPLYNSKTIRDISMKHDTLIKHNRTMCHVQELYFLLVFLELFLFDYFPYNFVATL